jgi:hypothetical protein
MAMRRGGWFAAAAAAASLSACALFSPRQPSATTTDVDPTPPDAGTLLSNVEAAEGPDVDTVVMARVSTGPKEGKHDSFVDFELRGLRSKALRMCGSLVQRELATVFPPDVNLETRVERPCSTAAMAEPDAGTPWLMARIVRVDEIQLLLLGEGREGQDGGAFQGVRAQRRELTGYQTETQCRLALERIANAQQQADKRADQRATAWLDSQLESQQKRTTESCRSIPETNECKKERMILKVLREHSTPPSGPASRPASAPASSSAPLCRQRT